MLARANSAGRLKSGISLQQAKARLQQSGTEYRTKYPNFGKDNSFGAETIQEAVVRNNGQTLLILSVAVGLVLLIACANVANLLLARAIGRRREIAIRAAIGAGRARMIRQLLTESLLLAFCGAILGLALGVLGIRALLAVNTAGLPRVGTDGALVSIDWRVLAFTAAITLLTSLIFGLFPALQASKADLASTLKESASRSGSGRGSCRSADGPAGRSASRHRTRRLLMLWQRQQDDL